VEALFSFTGRVKYATIAVKENTMRFIIILFLLLVLCFEGMLFVVFTAPGNNMLLPLLNSYLQQKVPQAKIVVQGFRLKPSSVAMIAKVNDTVDLKAEGALGLLDQTFDINYLIDTQEIKTPTLTLKEHIKIKGNVKGNPEDMTIRGKGMAFQSDIRYGLSLVKQTPQNIKIDIKDAALRSLLAVAGQKPYGTGKVSLHANMPDFRPLNPKIDATFSITQGELNTRMLAKDFNLTLPAKVGYKTHFLIRTKEGRVAFDGSIDSDLASLSLKEGRYHLLSNSLASDYRVSVPELGALSALTKSPMHGELILDGKATLKNNTPTLNGTTSSFGGKIDFSYVEDSLKLILSKVNNATLLYKLGQPKYAIGKTTATVKLTSLKHLKGDFKIRSKGSVNRAVVKKAFNLDLGKTFLFDTETEGKIKDQKISADLAAKTTMANLKATAIQYDIKKASLSAHYLLEISDMRRLKPLSGKDLIGSMRIDGKMRKTKDLLITGSGKEFGGTIDFTLLNDRFTANVKGATVSKVMTMLDYPQVLEALSQAKVDYNIASGSGTLHAKLDNARILPGKLTALLKQFKIIDLAKERFNNSTFDAKITKALIDFTLDARNKNNYLLVKHGKLIKKSGAINAKVALNIKGKDLQATIRGTVEHPKVSLDGSKFIENAIKEKVKKKYGKKIDKAKKRIKEKIGSQASELIKGLF